MPRTKDAARARPSALLATKLASLRGFDSDLVDADATDGVATLAYLQVHHAADLIVKSVERSLALSNLSVARYAILRMISAREPVTLGWIASRHFSRLSNITAVIDRLVRDGLVERLPDPNDRRIVRVKITPEGESLLEATRGPHRAFIAQTMGALGEADLLKLIELLGKLSEPLEPARGHPKGND